MDINQVGLIYSFYFLFAAVCAFLLAIPIINLLYKLNLTDFKKLSSGAMNAIFYKLHKHKAGTPSSGGLIILLLFVIPFIFSPSIHNPRNILLLICALSFSLLGLGEDIIKFLINKGIVIKELRNRYNLLIQIMLGTVFSYLIYTYIGITSLSIFNFTLNFNLITFTILGGLYLAWLITSLNITDGLDGLLTGMSLIALLGILVISILKQEFILGAIIAYFSGTLLAFLYFNINPARVFLGDVGSNLIASILALVSIYLDEIVPFTIIFLAFYINAMSSMIQLIALNFGKKVFPIAPLHHYLEHIGWSENKVVFRAWILQSLLTVLGLCFFFLGA